MTRMVSQILWEHCMGELGYWGNDYENDTFAVRSYNWVDEDANDWHFWHKPSGLKIEWYKYPLRGFEANMEITDDQFLDVLRDCTNSMEDGKAVRFLHDIRRWWADSKTENSSEKPNNCEVKICDTCRYYNSNIPCGSTPSACKEADKFAEEFVDGLKKLKPKDEPRTNTDQHVQHVESVEPTWTKEEHEAFYTFLWNVINPNEMQDYIGMFEPKDEPQTYITEDRDTQILDAWQVHHRNTTSIEDEPQTDCAWK